MSNINIINNVRAGLENIPKLTQGDLSPQSLFNRYQLTLQAFGMERLRMAVYRPGQEMEHKQQEQTYSAKEIADRSYTMHTGGIGKEMLSPLGTPVFCDVKLKAEDEPENQYLQLIWVLTDVMLVNNIVKTHIQGRNGTVKEYISRDDYRIKLRGAVSNTFSRAYPKKQMLRLISLCERGKNIDVISEYLQLFNIHSMVVEQACFKQNEGQTNIQTFDIDCVSDEPLLLRKKIK